LLDLIAGAVCDGVKSLWLLLTLEDPSQIGLLAHPDLSRFGHCIKLKLCSSHPLRFIAMLQQHRVILSRNVALWLLAHELLDHFECAASSLPLTRQNSAAFGVVMIGCRTNGLRWLRENVLGLRLFLLTHWCNARDRFVRIGGVADPLRLVEICLSGRLNDHSRPDEFSASQSRRASPLCVSSASNDVFAGELGLRLHVLSLSLNLYFARLLGHSFQV
jgi:hypothetical protein